MPLHNPGLLPEALGQGTKGRVREEKQEAEDMTFACRAILPPTTPLPQGAADSQVLLAAGRRQIPEPTPVVSAFSQEQIFRLYWPEPG